MMPLRVRAPAPVFVRPLLPASVEEIVAVWPLVVTWMVDDAPSVTVLL